MRTKHHQLFVTLFAAALLLSCPASVPAQEVIGTPGSPGTHMTVNERAYTSQLGYSQPK
jgi:hypothetical protein